MPMRTFATKKDEKSTEQAEDAAPIKKRRGRPPKAAKLEAEQSEPAPAKKTRTAKAKKLISDLEGAGDATMSEAMGGAASATKAKKTSKKSKVNAQKPIDMYVLKFNTPILPFAKFPLTHNRYIQEFVKSYEEDKDKVERIIGVHFP